MFSGLWYIAWKFNASCHISNDEIFRRVIEISFSFRLMTSQPCQIKKRPIGILTGITYVLLSQFTKIAIISSKEQF